jgi:acetyl esterase/lipase
MTSPKDSNLNKNNVDLTKLERHLVLGAEERRTLDHAMVLLQRVAADGNQKKVFKKLKTKIAI